MRSVKIMSYRISLQIVPVEIEIGGKSKNKRRGKLCHKTFHCKYKEKKRKSATSVMGNGEMRWQFAILSFSPLSSYSKKFCPNKPKIDGNMGIGVVM